MWLQLMKSIKFLVITTFLSLPVFGQDMEMFFNNGANQYIAGNTEQAKSTLMDGLRRYPNNQKLKALLDKINNQEEEQQQQDQKNQQQEQEKQQQEQQQNEQNQQEKGEQDQQQQNEEQQAQESEEQESMSEQQREMQKENESKAARDSLFQMQQQKEMQISPEKARMILEALRNNEIQYYQQRLRKSKQRPDKSKPDW